VQLRPSNAGLVPEPAGVAVFWTVQAVPLNPPASDVHGIPLNDSSLTWGSGVFWIRRLEGAVRAVCAALRGVEASADWAIADWAGRAGTRRIARPLTATDQGRRGLKARKARIVLPRSEGNPSGSPTSIMCPALSESNYSGLGAHSGLWPSLAEGPVLTTSSQQDRPTVFTASDERLKIKQKREGAWAPSRSAVGPGFTFVGSSTQPGGRYAVRWSIGVTLP
jgi:hypothetical protein